MSDAVEIERRGRVAVLQLNRPEQMNALAPDMLAAILPALVELDADPTIGAVVIAGHDRAFASGVDIRTMQHRPLSDVLTSHTARFWLRLAELEVPLVAAVSGHAYGGGFELALACDLVVASETARFGQLEIKVGIMPGGGGTQRLARVIGRQRTMELVLLGDVIDAVEAKALGLVNRVTDAAHWRDEAIALAERVATAPPIAARMAKRAVLGAEEMGLKAGIAHERRLMEVAFATDDRVEGMTAFLEKRTPVWKGQ